MAGGLKKAQSVIEYGLLLTAVILAAVWGAKNIILDRAKNMMNSSGNIMNTSIAVLENATNSTP